MVEGSAKAAALEDVYAVVACAFLCNAFRCAMPCVGTATRPTAVAYAFVQHVGIDVCLCRVQYLRNAWLICWHSTSSHPNISSPEDYFKLCINLCINSCSVGLLGGPRVGH
jgi:hypothetical protein